VRIERRLDDHDRRLDTIERGRATDPVCDPRDPRPV
jgi:hypothetical protein